MLILTGIIYANLSIASCVAKILLDPSPDISLYAEMASRWRLITKLCSAAVLLVLLLSGSYVDAQNEDGNVTVLHLLTLIPPGNKSDSLLLAAELAAFKINARDDLLPGCRLELISAVTEPCNETLIIEPYRSFVKYAASGGPFNIVAVTGMICATVTQAISPLAGRQDIDLLQISAGAAPPVFANAEDYPRLYRVISSSAVQSDALLKLMEAFQWRRISILSDSTLIDHSGAAHDLINKVSEDPHLTLVSQEVVTPRSVFPAFTRTISNAAKIIYVSMAAEEVRRLLCAAYEQGRIWPTYVWILRVEEDLLLGSEKCGNVTMQEVLENSIIFRYRTEPNDLNSMLVSGQTYSEYQQHLGANITNEDVFANALHDSVWAFTLALNQSLQNFTSEDLQHYGLGNNLTSVIESNLKMVNFSGVTGQVHFNENRESDTEVNIFQVKNGTAVPIGCYNPHSQNLTLSLPPETMISKDDFETVRLKLHPAMPIVTLIVVGLLVVVTTIILFLFLYEWNKPAIKATSPYLSLLILAGCYLLYGAVTILAMREYIDNFGELCQALLCFDVVGMLLIYGTLFVRLLRVCRIFFCVFRKPGKLWSDWSLFIVVLLIVMVAAIILILWATMDPLLTIKIQFFIPFVDPPHHAAILFCDSNYYYAWISVLYYVYLASIVFFVGILAIFTRKIKIAGFRDTKEVSMFIFISIAALTICFAYLTIFAEVGIIEAAYTFEVLQYLPVAILCKVFLFMPKIWSARFQKRKRRPSTAFYTTSHSTIRRGSSIISLRRSSASAATMQGDKPRRRGSSNASLLTDVSMRRDSMTSGSLIQRDSSMVSMRRGSSQLSVKGETSIRRGSLQFSMQTSQGEVCTMHPPINEIDTGAS